MHAGGVVPWLFAPAPRGKIMYATTRTLKHTDRKAKCKPAGFLSPFPTLLRCPCTSTPARARDLLMMLRDALGCCRCATCFNIFQMLLLPRRVDYKFGHRSLRSRNKNKKQNKKPALGIILQFAQRNDIIGRGIYERKIRNNKEKRSERRPRSSFVNAFYFGSV